MSVTSPTPPTRIEGWEVLDLLSSLVQKSLVLYEEDKHGCGRYRLLETVRQYGRDRLVEAGDAEAIRDRHLELFLALTEEAQADEDRVAGHGHLSREYDNLRAALAWSLEGPRASDICLRLAGSLTGVWHNRGYSREGQGWLERALARAEGTKRTAAWVRAINGLGNLTWSQGDFPRACSLLAEAVATAQEIGDQRGLAWGLHQLGVVAHLQGDWERARSFSEECLLVSRALGDKHRIAFSLGMLADYAFSKGDWERARSLHEESLALMQQSGDPQSARYAIRGLAKVALAQGDYEAARTLFGECLAIHREVGHKGGIAASLRDLGDVATKQRNFTAARAFYGESLSLRCELGEKHFVAVGLERLAGLAAACGQPERAARLFGAAEALREAVGFFASATDEDRDALRKGAFAAAWAEGRVMSLDEVVAFALAAEA